MGRHRNFVPLLVMLPFFYVALPAKAADYKFFSIAVPGATILYLNAINGDDEVAGEVSLSSGSPQYQGFVWKGGAATLVADSFSLQSINSMGVAAGYPPDGQTRSPGEYVTYDSRAGTVMVRNTGLNSPVVIEKIAPSGEVFGTELKEGNGGNSGPTVPFSFKKKVQKYRIPGERFGIVRSANNQGDLMIQCEHVGHNCCQYELYHAGSYTAIYAPGTDATYPYAVLENGQVVGQAVVGSAFEGFIESAGTYTLYPGPTPFGTVIVGVGPSGEIIGNYVDTNKNQQSFVITNGTTYTLSIPGAIVTQIQTVGSSGALIGFWLDAQNTEHAFIAKCTKGQICTAING